MSGTPGCTARVPLASCVALARPATPTMVARNSARATAARDWRLPGGHIGKPHRPPVALDITSQTAPACAAYPSDARTGFAAGSNHCDHPPSVVASALNGNDPHAGALLDDWQAGASVPVRFNSEHAFCKELA